MDHALDLRWLIGDEVSQRRESGYELDGVLPRVQEALATGSSGWLPELERAYDVLEGTQVRPGWPYAEPSDLEEILAALGDNLALQRPGDKVLADRVHAAWLGRCAGCTLGKPVEGHGWDRKKLRRYLDQAGSYPITDYLPVLDPIPGGWCSTTAGGSPPAGGWTGWRATTTSITPSSGCTYWSSMASGSPPSR